MSHLRHVSFALLATLLLLCSLAGHVSIAHAASPFVAVPVGAAQQETLISQYTAKMHAAAESQINAEIERDLGVTADAPCLMGQPASIMPQTTPLPDVALALNVSGPANGSTVTLPASFAYTITVQNIGDAATPKPFTIYFNYGSMAKSVTKKYVIKTLAVNETRQITGTIVPKTDGTLNIEADAATECLFPEKDTTNNSSDSRYFTLLSPGVDFVAGGWDILPQATHIGDGVLDSAETYTLQFGMTNNGTNPSTTDVDVRLVSPLFGSVTVTIPAGQLPGPGGYAYYDVDNVGTTTPHIFTAPIVKKATRYAFSMLINTNHKTKEASYANNTDKGGVQVNPVGVNLRGIGYISGDGCGFVVGATTYTLTAFVNNGGTMQAGPSQALLYFDKTLLGTYNVPALAGGSSATLVSKIPAPVVKTAGMHTVTVIVDSAHQVSEYDESDNKHTEKYVFRKAAP